jgi:predicted acylesterase/phospholipase RssA
MRNINQFFDDVASVSGNMSQRVIELFSGDAQVIDRVFGLMEMSVFVSNDPLIDLIANTIDFANIRTSEKMLIIAATNWAKGETQLFRENEMSDQLGPDIIRASAAIPGIYPQQRVGAFTYVDGGVLMNTPLSPAIDAGANVLHVISLNPEVDKIPLPEMPNMVETILRQQTMTWVKAVDQNVNKVYYANRLLEVANLTRQLVDREIGESADTTLTLNISPEIEELMTMRRPWEKKLEIGDRTIEFDVPKNLAAETAPYVPVTVYLYRPDAALGGALGMGDFRHDRILQLIERGFDDAVNFQENDKNYVAPYPLRYKQAQSRVDHVARITRAEPFVRQPEDERQPEDIE